MIADDDELHREIAAGAYVRDVPRLRDLCGGLEPIANLLQRAGVTVDFIIEMDDGGDFENGVDMRNKYPNGKKFAWCAS